MSAQDFPALMARLSAAVERIERALSAKSPAADADLQARHDALRAEVRETVAALDGVIARQQSGDA
jgi:hypothetical protein